MSALEPGSDRDGGNLGHRSTVSAAISAKRSADTLERIEALLVALSPPDAGEVRTYRDGVEDAARVADADMPQYDEVDVAAGEARAAIRIAAAIRKLP